MREYLRPMVRAVCLALMAIGATSVTGPRLGIAEMRITESATSSGLGIAEMRITERANRTVITAVNADNQTIAKLDLVHGRFVPTEYGPEFRGREVQGRKLYVEVRGQVITWETIGFTDTTHMPALPPNVNQVASFLSDSRVRSVLKKWRIGWAPAPAPIPRTLSATLFNDIVSIRGIPVSGTLVADCSGQLTCGPPIRGQVPTTCGGTDPASYSFMILSEDGHEMIMASCCPNSPNGPLFGVKLCPLTSNLSSCGMTVTGACATCPGFPQPYAPSCSLSIRYDNWNRLYIHHCNAAPGTPPTIAVGPPIEIWPPNHEMRTFTLADFVTSAVDACENAIDVNARGTITSITSNESVSDDFAITGSSFEVRADRDGFGNGRVYEIHFSVPDASGTSASGVALVRVPHDRK